MLARSRSVNATVYLLAAVLSFSLFFLSLPNAGPGCGRALADPGTGWENQSENYYGHHRNAVCALDESTAWVAGEYGSILKTGDGGATWALQGCGTTKSLSSISAADSANVWAVSREGEILKTSNGGTEWVIQKTGAGVPESVSAADASTAWVAGSEYGTLMNRMIWKTTDGGSTWIRKDTPSGMGLTCISAVDANTAWAVSPQMDLFGSSSALFKTVDGGDTWKSQGSDVPGLRAVSAVSADVAWAVGYSGAVIRTVDGGENWVAVRTGTEDLSSVSALDDQVAWVAGAGGIILATTDGGTTWSQQAPVAARLNSVYAVSPSTAWAVGGNGVIIKTSNGGTSWLEMIDTSRGMTRKLNCVSAVDPLVAWAGGEGVLLRTVDGGETWGAVYESPTTHILDIHTVDENNVWVVGREGDAISGTGFIYKTTDGGASWNLQFHLAGGSLTGISALDASTAWAVGTGGTILKTVNGGASWAVQGSGTTCTLTSVSAVNRDMAWASGLSLSYSSPNNSPPPFENAPYYPIILKTSDGGATWSANQLGTYNEGFTAIDAADADHVIAVGTDLVYSPIPGVAVKDPFIFPPQYYFCLVLLARYGSLVTRDGGISWLPQAANLPVTLNDVCVAGADTAWVVGSGGTIFRTVDGAATWAQQASGTGFNLEDISAVDSSTAWAVGEYGTILRYAGASSPKPEIVSITPASAAQFTWAANLQVAGTGFQPGATVRLEKGAAVLAAYSVSVVSGEQINCTVSLFGAEPGTYDVVMVNPGGQEARLPGSFTVTSLCGAGSGTSMLMLGLTLGLLSLAGTARLKRKREKEHQENP